MTRYKIMKNMENEQEKEKIYFKLFYPLTIELWIFWYVQTSISLLPTTNFANVFHPLNY